MARKTVTAYTDDLTGNPIDDADVRTISFTYKGKRYEMDLSPESEIEVDNVFSGLIAAARPVRRQRAASAGNPANTAAAREESRRIREWAKDNGVEVASRGRIPDSVRDQYRSATGE